MAAAKLSNGAVEIGPLWNRTVFDASKRLVKYRGRKICSFDEVKGLILREYIARDEEEQLLNLHPEVQKRPRDAELWVEVKAGPRRLVATLDRAGRLLQLASEAAQLLGVPMQAERTLISPGEPSA